MDTLDRNVKMKFTTLLVLFLAGNFLFMTAQEERRFIRQGTEKYNAGNYVESGNDYWKALDKNQNSLEARFNVAATMFKQEKYDDAITQLQALSNQTTDKEILGKIYHNIGNSFLAKQELDKGIESYKTALKNNPTDDETRYNLIAAMKMKKQQEEQEKQQEQQQEQKQDQEKEQEKNSNLNKSNRNSSTGISKENAERLLQAMEQDEKKLQEKLNQKKEAQPVRIEKNW
jgi:Ca-activated chloride channel homolog